MIKTSFAIGLMAGGLAAFVAVCSPMLPARMSLLLLLLIFMQVFLVWIILALLKDNGSRYSARQKFKQA